jgi:hypothetical protein
MDPRVLDARDSVALTDDKGAANAWHDEARAWMSQRPDSTAAATKSSDTVTERVAPKAEKVETPEVKEAYKSMLEKTRGVDPATVADSMNLFADLAATGANVSKFADSIKDNAAAPNTVKADVALNPEAVQPEVAQAYTRLLQRGFNPVLITDVLNVAGDVAAIALSPAGHKLFEDIKSLIGHIAG